jgi:hypothetical protein
MADNDLTRTVTGIAKTVSLGALTTLLTHMSFKALLKFLLKTGLKTALSELYGMFIFLQFMVVAPLIKARFPAISLTVFSLLN